LKDPGDYENEYGESDISDYDTENDEEGVDATKMKQAPISFIMDK